MLSDPNILIPNDAGKEWEKRFRVYFPSVNTVKESIGGPQSAGTICFMSRWYEDARFQRHVFRECISRRKGLLMHNKVSSFMMWQFSENVLLTSGFRCCLHGHKSPFNSLMGPYAKLGVMLAVLTCLRVLGEYSPMIILSGLIYMNISDCANYALRHHRGRLVQDRSTKAPKLNCRNWECGVLVPIIKPLDEENGGEKSPSSTLSPSIVDEMPKKSREAVADDQIKENTDIAVTFGDTVPVPMQVPSRSYGPDLKPWYYMED
jgi:tyrosyl-DNA phosphodiesterase